MYVKLNGEMVYLWRAVDHEGETLESFITKTRDKDAALTFIKKALKRHGSPEITTHAKWSSDPERVIASVIFSSSDFTITSVLGHWHDHRLCPALVSRDEERKRTGSW
jgi:hypothetical protein